MSVVFVISILVVNVMLMHGLELYSLRDANDKGEKTLCDQLHCVEDATSESEISSLVNMSVYRIDGDVKLLLASILASDSRVRDYNVDGVEVDGKISTKTVEMTVSVTQETGCQDGVWACDVHYIDRTGHIGKRENKTSSGLRRPKNVFSDLNRKTQGQSEILLSFKDFNQIKDIDINMKLKFSNFNNNNNYQFDKSSFNQEKQNAERLTVNNKEAIGKHGEKNKSTKQLTKQKKQIIYEDITTKFNQSERLENNVNDLLRTVSLQEEKINNFSLLLSALNESNKNQQERMEKMEQEFTEELNQLKDGINLFVNANNTNDIANQNIALHKLPQILSTLKVSSANVNKSLDNLALIVNIIGKYKDRSELIQNILTNTNNDYSEDEILKKVINLACSKNTKQCSNPHEIPTTDNKKLLCDSVTDGGGWIVIQRRIGHREYNYQRMVNQHTWGIYKSGFGHNSGDLWLGNDWIARLTSMGYTDLRIELKYKKKHYYATYSNFTVGNESMKYKMSYSSYNGNVSDGLKDHNGMNFSTYDQDNDQWPHGSCAKSHTGGWWFNKCLTSNLNGIWGSLEFGKGVNWENLTGWRDSLEFTEMKLRLPG
ncbi:fibroleukin-like [Physella acuta]|uniref:fibroleukin-like n=1 Tax=Physella acuta TaxID=109671 RepID=UPI0027DB2692|nr:fibroleukin-like [Physella acuta]